MRQHLLVDADDTLWENNIYFEQAIHTFISFLDHSRLSREEVRALDRRAIAPRAAQRDLDWDDVPGQPRS